MYVPGVWQLFKADAEDAAIIDDGLAFSHDAARHGSSKALTLSLPPIWILWELCLGGIEDLGELWRTHEWCSHKINKLSPKLRLNSKICLGILKRVLSGFWIRDPQLNHQGLCHGFSPYPRHAGFEICMIGRFIRSSGCWRRYEVIAAATSVVNITVCAGVPAGAETRARFILYN